MAKMMGRPKDLERSRALMGNKNAAGNRTSKSIGIKPNRLVTYHTGFLGLGKQHTAFGVYKDGMTSFYDMKGNIGLPSNAKRIKLYQMGSDTVSNKDFAKEYYNNVIKRKK